MWQAEGGARALDMVPGALHTTACLDAGSVERECLTFVTSHSLNMVTLAKHIEWERVREAHALFVVVT